MMSQKRKLFAALLDSTASKRRGLWLIDLSEWKKREAKIIFSVTVSLRRRVSMHAWGFQYTEMSSSGTSRCVVRLWGDKPLVRGAIPRQEAIVMTWNVLYDLLCKIK